MGNSASRSTEESKSKNSNGKKIELFVEICSSWGFGGKKNQVVSQLVSTLNNQGYDVVYTCEPMSGGNGEYYVYVVKDGNKKIVFSNNKSHSTAGATIGYSISSKNINEIVSNILA